MQQGEKADRAEATAQDRDDAVGTIFIRVRSDGYRGSLTDHEIEDGSKWADETWQGWAFTEYAIPLRFSPPAESGVAIALTPPAHTEAA